MKNYLLAAVAAVSAFCACQETEDPAVLELSSEENPDLYGQYMFIINGKRTFKVNKDARSQGMNVRCVAE